MIATRSILGARLALHFVQRLLRDLQDALRGLSLRRSNDVPALRSQFFLEQRVLPAEWAECINAVNVYEASRTYRL